MKKLIFTLLLLAGFLTVWGDPPERMIRLMINAESRLLMCRSHLAYGNLEASLFELTKGFKTLDSLDTIANLQSYPFYVQRLAGMRKETGELQRQIRDGNRTLTIESILPNTEALSADETNESETEEAENLTEVQMQDLILQLGALMSDTAILSNQIRDINLEKQTLSQELHRYTSGIFLGLGFGYNYFLNAPYSYYIKPDSSLGRFGKNHGTSFILSGFIAYKIKPRHSVIFNVPLGDITNREDYRIGLFNKKIAGGLGYGYNMGSVSIIGIINLSPYDAIEYSLVQEEKFEGDRFTKLSSDSYPSTTKYSPSFTIGLSYNFVAPESFLFNGF